MLFVKEAVSGAGAGCNCMQPCQMLLFLLNCRSAQELPFVISQMPGILHSNGRFDLTFLAQSAVPQFLLQDKAQLTIFKKQGEVEEA
jgi:hypothetical protein